MARAIRFRLGEDGAGRFVVVRLDTVEWVVFASVDDFTYTFFTKKWHEMPHDDYVRCLDHFAGRKDARDA